jgi:hypothetical protein
MEEPEKSSDTSVCADRPRSDRIRLGLATAILSFLTTFLVQSAPGRAALEYPNRPGANSLLEPPTTDANPVKVTIALGLLNMTDIDEVGQRFHPPRRAGRWTKTGPKPCRVRPFGLKPSWSPRVKRKFRCKRLQLASVVIRRYRGFGG